MKQVFPSTLALFLALMMGVAPASAGTTTLAIPAGTATARLGTDGSGNVFANMSLCDGPACANMATVKGPSTAPLAADPALVVSISPNSTAAVTAAAGAFADGSQATIGTKADVANIAPGNTLIAAIRQLDADVVILNTTAGSSIAPGANPIGSIGNTVFGAASSPVITNPTSTLTLPATTTAYAAGNVIASSATAGSIIVPSFAIANSAGGALISRLRLSTNDTTATAYPAVTIQVDLWLAAPTFTNGDRGVWLPATGSANHFATFSCTMSGEYGDGAYAECAPITGSVTTAKLAAGTSIFWTLKAASASGVTGASKIFTLTAETLN